MSRRGSAPPDKKRGRHKKRRSAETLRFERDQLVPLPPPWMDAATYVALVNLRADCDGSRVTAARGAGS